MTDLRRTGGEENDPSLDFLPTIARNCDRKLRMIKESIASKNNDLKQLIRDHDDGSIIDLSGKSLTDHHMPTIVTYAIYEKHCKGLNLWNNQFTSHGASILSDELYGNKTVKEVDLSYNRLSDEGVKVLCDVLSSKTCILKEIDLSSNNIGDRGADYLANMLKENKNLKRLILNKNNITNNGLHLLMDAIAYNNTTLIRLNLESNVLITTSGIDPIFDRLKDNKTLEELYLRECGWTETEDSQNLRRLREKAIVHRGTYIII